MDFSQALLEMKAGRKCARDGWLKSGIFAAVQLPDKNSANTLPYLYMVKNDGATRFPLDLSCESIFAEDWSIVD